MQNLAQLLPLQPIDSQTETQEQFEMPHLTQMLYTYIYNMGLSDNAGSITQKLDSFILERTSQISSETGLLSGKSNLVKQALEEIKANYLSWQTQLDRPISAQLDTPDSIKQDIKKTLKCYQKYFLSKFSSDGSIENCDQTIRDIFLNFDENSRFLDSINDSRDINNLKKLLKFLNNYLIELTITTEFKIKDGLDEEQPQREEDLNKIKTILLTFPGGNSSESSRIDFACIDGTVERIQEAISALSDCSIESRLIREKMETATTKFAENVPAGQQIHIGPCLLATLMLDIRKISEIDGSFATPKQNILLKEVIIFGYNFTKAIRDELSQTTENLLGQYCELLAKRNEDGAVTTISYRDLMEFVERSKYSGFAIDDIYNLFNDQDFVLESHEIEVTKLITSQQLKEKYFQIPTQKFKEELSKAQHSITQDLGGSELELGLKFDYLKYLLDPQNLFKVETISSRETSASGEAISADETVITSRIDPQKFQHLIALLLHKNIEVKSEETEYLYAGLITLRNLLDSYVTTDNLFLHFERFDHEFRKKTGIGFVDFFYEEHDGELHPKDEFKKVKSILQTIISKINYQKELFFANIEETAPLKALIEELFKLSETQDSQDSQDSQRSLIQALILNEQYHAVKNGLGENFLQILYQFDAQIFRKVLKGAPPQLITKTNITSLDDQGLSLIKILAEAGDKESLCLTLKKYKDNTSLDNLIALINDQNLLFDLVKENRLDILEEIFKIVSPEIKRVLDKVDSNNNTILLIACKKGYTKIALALIKAQASLDQDDINGATPLCVACFYGHTEIAKALIEAGASLNQADINGLTPLYIACFRGHTEIVKALIKAMVEKNKDHLNQVNKDDLTPLFAACQEGHTEIVKALIDAGADYNLSSKDGATPLYKACFRGHIEIAKAIIQAMVKNGDNLNQFNNDGFSPLFAACQEGHTEIVKALIEAKANYNLRKKNGATPLYKACFRGHTEIVKALIEAGADYNLSSEDGATPLFVACQNGHTEIAKAIIQAMVRNKDDLNQVDKNGLTPLFIACQEGHTEIAEALFNGGANFYYTQKSSIFFRAFRCLAYDLRDVSPEIKALITKFTDPKRIKFRDQTLEKAKISKRQVEFNNNARSELDLQFLDNPSPRADGITELSESSQLQQYRKNFQKEFINGLLFLKFVALEFSSNEKSILTPEERISEMLKIYLSENKILKDIPLIIDRVVNNENGLQDFFKTATIQELIALGLNSQPEISALEFAQKDQEQLDQMLSENVEEKLNEIITSICSSKYPLRNAISSGRPTGISSLTFANIENLDSSRVTNLRSVRREDARKGITTRYAL